MSAANPQPPLRFVPVDDMKTEYANLVRVAHSPLELVFDFARMLPGEDHADIFERVIMSPLGAKLLQRALTENLNRYEAAYGEIIMPSSNSLADQLFKPGGPPPGPSPKE